MKNLFLWLLLPALPQLLCINEQININNLFSIVNHLEKENEIDAAVLILKEIEKNTTYKETLKTKLLLTIAKLLKKTKGFDEALEYLQQAYEGDQENYDVLLAMSEIYRAQQKLDKAENVINLIQPINETIKIKVLFEKAAILNAQQRYQEALTMYKTLLISLPNNPTILHNYAYTLRALEQLPEAISFYEQAAAENKNSEATLFAKALAELAQGNLKSGFKGYELRRKQLKTASERLYTQKELWNGVDSLIGKKILVFAEQGLGDTFQFIRYANTLKRCGAYVIVAVQERLQHIIGLCPYIDEVIPLKSNPPDHDYYAPLMSLPSIFETTIGTIPCSDKAYLYASKALTFAWKEKLEQDKSIRIGICFQSGGQLMNPFGNVIPSNRSIPASILIKSLTNIDGITLYCLQHHVGLDQLTEEMRKKIIVFEEHFDKKHGAFMDTAAVMQHLDLVISVDTSVAHLAGGLHIPTFILLPKLADWRWMTARSDSPWYETVTLFRQSEYNNWGSVIKELVNAVSLFIQTKNNPIPKKYDKGEGRM